MRAAFHAVRAHGWRVATTVYAPARVSRVKARARRGGRAQSTRRPAPHRSNLVLWIPVDKWITTDPHSGVRHLAGLRALRARATALAGPRWGDLRGERRSLPPYIKSNSRDGLTSTDRAAWRCRP